MVPFARALFSLRQATKAAAIVVAIIALTLAATPSHAQTSKPVPPRLSHPQAQYFKDHPAAWAQFTSQLPRRPASAPQTYPDPSPWQALTNAPPVEGLSAPLLLTDGTVIGDVTLGGPSR